MEAIQSELFSLDAEDFGVACREVPYSDWAIDCQPVQERSMQDIRSIWSDRAKDTRPKLWTKPEYQEQTVHNQLWTKPEDSTVHNQLWTKPEYQEQTVHNSPAKSYRYDLPNMYRSWSKNHQYWYIKPYIDGQRKTFHLGKDYDRAVAKGRKILAEFGIAA